MEFEFKHNAAQVQAEIARLAAEAMPLAASIAVDAVAKQARSAVQQKMGEVFDRPTRYTLNSMKLTLSRNKNATAYLGFKTQGPKASQDPTEWRAPQVLGGERAEKRSEYLMRQAGVLLPGYYAVPGPGARRDQYGNISRGQMQQILAAVQASFDVPTRTKRGTRNKVTQAIFAIRSAGHNLPPGVYQRIGYRVVTLLRFVPKPSYRKRLPFVEVAQQVMADRYVAEFLDAVAKVGVRMLAK